MKTITINNIKFRSRSEACKKLNISYMTLLSAIRNKKSEIKSKDGRIFSLTS